MANKNKKGYPYIWAVPINTQFELENNVSAYIIGSLFANVLWGVTHIIFPLVNNVNNLEPLWSYITFGIGNGLLYTALFLIFRKNVSAPVLFHAVIDMCNKLL